MALKRISDLGPASALDGTESVPVDQAGTTVQTTTQAIANLVAGGGGGINDQVETAYTLVLTDAGKDVRCTNAAAVTLTVPADALVAFPIGTMIAFSQGGAGAVTATSDGTSVIQGANGAATTAQYDARVLEKTDTDTWRVW